MSEQRQTKDWKCPWGICDHEQAQKCRQSRTGGKRQRGCGAYFPANTTPAQAKAMIVAVLKEPQE